MSPTQLEYVDIYGTVNSRFDKLFPLRSSPKVGQQELSSLELYALTSKTKPWKVGFISLKYITCDKTVFETDINVRVDISWSLHIVFEKFLLFFASFKLALLIQPFRNEKWALISKKLKMIQSLGDLHIWKPWEKIGKNSKGCIFLVWIFLWNMCLKPKNSCD